MTHEIKLLFETLSSWQEKGKKAVFVSVVALDGSSYRRPGVRMIISDDGEAVGSVSGGCVEQEIVRQSASVFQKGISKIMTYDGRLRIGCDGILYILIERIFLSDELLRTFKDVLVTRQNFRMDSYYFREAGEYGNIGTVVSIQGKTYALNQSFSPSVTSVHLCFTQSFGPVFKLCIFGAEHDSVQLCQAASQLGWEVTVIASADESKSCDFFPGAASLITPSFDNIDTTLIDDQTAIVVMTHSFNKDVRYLMSLTKCKPAYLGIVGSVNRRERLLSSLLEYCPETPVEFLEMIHGPAGLNVGAETASEISVSVLAEILSVIRHQKPMSLKQKQGSIHG